jgi:hypothetical protein
MGRAFDITGSGYARGGQIPPPPRPKTDEEAWSADRDAIRGDVDRALGRRDGRSPRS